MRRTYLLTSVVEQEFVTIGLYLFTLNLTVPTTLRIVNISVNVIYLV